MSRVQARASRCAPGRRRWRSARAARAFRMAATPLAIDPLRRCAGLRRPCRRAASWPPPPIAPSQAPCSPPAIRHPGLAQIREQNHSPPPARSAPARRRRPSMATMISSPIPRDQDARRAPAISSRPTPPWCRSTGDRRRPLPTPPWHRVTTSAGAHRPGTSQYDIHRSRHHRDRRPTSAKPGFPGASFAELEHQHQHQQHGWTVSGQPRPEVVRSACGPDAPRESARLVRRVTHGADRTASGRRHRLEAPGRIINITM